LVLFWEMFFGVRDEGARLSLWLIIW